MVLKVIASGSKGNAYILENEHEALIIEVGVRFSKIKEALNFNIGKVTAALCTHKHLDHAKGMKEALDCEIKVITSKGTADALGIEHRGLRFIKNGQKMRIGNFDIMAFDVHHDVPEPLGFLIRHDEAGLICFLTDTTHCNYRFPGLNNVIVEANYCEDIINERLKYDKRFLRDRVIESHMNINTCRDFLLANDLSNVNHIVLIHLSDSNSNEQQFHHKITAATGKTVTIAKPGVVIENFNAAPL